MAFSCMPCLGHDEVAQIAAAYLFGANPNMLGKGWVGVKNAVGVHDGDCLRDAGEDVFHQPRLGAAVAHGEVGNDDSFAQIGVEDAVSALERRHATFAGEGGMKLVAACGTRQQGLWFCPAWEEAPDHLFDGSLHPFRFAEAHHAASGDVREDDLSGALEKYEHRERIEDFALLDRIRVLRQVQSDRAPGEQRRRRALVTNSERGYR